MNKKGDVHVPWTLIAVLLAIAVAIWAFSGPLATMLYGSQEIRKKAEETLKGWRLEDLPKETVELLTPLQYMDNLFQDAEDNFLEGRDGLVKENLDKAKKYYIEYIEKCDKDPKYKEGCRQSLKDKSQQRLKEIEEAYKTINVRSDLDKIDELKTTSERRRGYEDFIKKYSDSEEKLAISLVGQAETSLSSLKKTRPSDHEEYKSKLNEIARKIRPGLSEITYNQEINELNSFINDLKIKTNSLEYNDLIGEANYWVLNIYRNQKRCDDSRTILTLIEREYRDTIFVTGYEGRPILKSSYQGTLACYYENKDYNAVYDLMNLYKEKGYEGLESIQSVYLQKIVFNFVESVDCRKYDGDSKNCASSEKILNFKGEDIKIYLTPEQIKDKPNLACYYVYSSGRCYNCREEKKALCEHYGHEFTCMDDPCKVRDGPCNWDDGGSSWDLGIVDAEGCCPHDKLKC
jgi:hypothetical protein